MKHNEDKLYSFIMRGELTKISLKNKGVSKKSISNDELLKEYTTILPFDRLDEECVANARIMSKYMRQLPRLKIWFANSL